MERIISNETLEDIINTWLPITEKFQKCSFILPSGKFIKLEEHYEVYRALLVKQLVQCIPDAEQLLSELGYLRFSYIGYLILPELNLTDIQYKSLELALTEISRYRNEISVQLYENPKLYVNYNLNDIPNIIKKIKLYYSSKTLLP